MNDFYNIEMAVFYDYAEEYWNFTLIVDGDEYANGGAPTYNVALSTLFGYVRAL